MGNFLDPEILAERVGQVLEYKTPLVDVSFIGRKSETKFLIYELQSPHLEPGLVVHYFVEQKTGEDSTILRVERFFHVVEGGYFSVRDLKGGNRNQKLEYGSRAEFDFVNSALATIPREFESQIADYEKVILDTILKKIEDMLEEEVSTGFDERRLSENSLRDIGHGVIALSGWLKANDLIHYDGTLRSTYGSGPIVTATLSSWQLKYLRPYANLLKDLFDTDDMHAILSFIDSVVKFEVEVSVFEREFAVQVHYQPVAKSRAGRLTALAVLKFLSSWESDLPGALVQDFESFMKSEIKVDN